MDVRIVLALIAGWILGVGFVYWILHRGLDSQEWLYLKSFWDALRWKRYRELGEEERSEDDDGEQDRLEEQADEQETVDGDHRVHDGTADLSGCGRGEG